jgi:hypothetical protein
MGALTRRKIQFKQIRRVLVATELLPWASVSAVATGR